MDQSAARGCTEGCEQTGKTDGLMDHIPPPEIMILFDTEENAAEKGRQAFLDWVKTINAQIGDRICVPIVRKQSDEEYSVCCHWYEKDRPGLQ